MNPFRRRLGERCADVADWIDYRPDANFWPLFAIPPVLSAFWAYAGPIGLGLVLGFALLAVVLVAFLAVCAALGWVVANAARDLVSTIGLRPSMVQTPARVPSRMA